MKKIAWLFTMVAALAAASCANEETEGTDPSVDPPALPSGGNPPPSNPPPSASPRTNVPDELVGAWQNGWIDFAFWENYTEGYWAGRNATPSREAMIFRKNGSAKFYRYEFLFNFYEELIDTEGTVSFHGDGTFTFHPVTGRKRFHDFRTPSRTVDRPLTSAELIQPKLAGRRGYSYDPSQPDTLRITVPTSAPYSWYRKEEGGASP